MNVLNHLDVNAFIPNIQNLIAVGMRRVDDEAQPLPTRDALERIVSDLVESAYQDVCDCTYDVVERATRVIQATEKALQDAREELEATSARLKDCSEELEMAQQATSRLEDELYDLRMNIQQLVTR